MFGDISVMVKQLQETQQKVEETKKRLNSVFIDEETPGKVKVTVTANREIKSIEVDHSILQDAEELEDYLVLTINKALSKAMILTSKKWLRRQKVECPIFQV